MIDDSLWKENEDSKALKELNLEKSQLESELEVGTQTILPVHTVNSVWINHSIFLFCYK